MRVFILLMIMALPNGTGPGTISRINSLKEKAREAYLAGKYKDAATAYKTLVDSLGVDDDPVVLNLASSLFQLGDSSAAKYYRSLTTSANPSVRSKARLQLGVMANRMQKQEEALRYFKDALKDDPTNDDARYNYELLKKLMQKNPPQKNQDQKNQQNQKDQQQNQQQGSQKNEDQKNNPQNKDQQNQSQDNKKQQQQGNQDQDKNKPQDSKDLNSSQQENADQQKDAEKTPAENAQGDDKKNAQKADQELAEKLKAMNMSEERARMILEAMKNQEIQYLQQNKRKATQPRDNGKPDW